MEEDSLVLLALEGSESAEDNPCALMDERQFRTARLPSQTLHGNSRQAKQRNEMELLYDPRVGNELSTRYYV